MAPLSYTTIYTALSSITTSTTLKVAHGNTVSKRPACNAHVIPGVKLLRGNSPPHVLHAFITCRAGVKKENRPPPRPLPGPKSACPERGGLRTTRRAGDAPLPPPDNGPPLRADGMNGRLSFCSRRGGGKSRRREGYIYIYRERERESRTQMRWSACGAERTA